MSVFYVEIESIDQRVVTCAIDTLDINIERVPEQPTFALGLIVELCHELRTIKP